MYIERLFLFRVAVKKKSRQNKALLGPLLSSAHLLFLYIESLSCRLFTPEKKKELKE